MDIYDETAAVLTARGVEYKPADLYGFVRAAEPTDSSAEEMADSWVEAVREWHRDLAK